MDKDIASILRDFKIEGDRDKIIIYLIANDLFIRSHLQAIYGCFPEVAAAALGKEQKDIEEKLEEIRKVHEADFISGFLSKYGKIRDKNDEPS